MTNPNDGLPVTMPVPEVLEGSNPFVPELDRWDDGTTANEMMHTVRRMATHLDAASAYGKQLWHHLERVATYLREDIAHGTGEVAGGRERWAQLYATTLQLLSSPHGDNGFGAEQAQLELQNLGGRRA